MKFAFFYHSLVSDWNHGNAHFLRGVVSELIERGHDVSVYEPSDGWSRENLRKCHGDAPIREFHTRYPHLSSNVYNPSALNLDVALDDADVVLVHEWNSADLIRRIGAHHRNHRRYRLFFHDTHHRSVSDPNFLPAGSLRDYDGVLAFGEALRRLYREKHWGDSVWVWHEAADTRVFRPLPCPNKAGELVWIGNWGDNERTAELAEFLLSPVRALRLRSQVFGVRYPNEALRAMAGAGIEYHGWLQNFRAPEVFARFLMTVHIPRAPYRTALPGIPTIRVFEALACGIPLICAPWDDCENLFTPGKDYLIANNGSEMKEMMQELTNNQTLRSELAEHGLKTIASRHTCRHRVDQLLEIVQ
jgi:spore maturation protein CgeB